MMASPTRWTWVWAGFGSWWWTGEAWHAAKSRTLLSDWTELPPWWALSSHCVGTLRSRRPRREAQGARVLFPWQRLLASGTEAGSAVGWPSCQAGPGGGLLRGCGGGEEMGRSLRSVLLGWRAGVEWRLQDSGRKHDLVLGGRVVGVHHGRGHAPPASETHVEDPTPRRAVGGDSPSWGCREPWKCGFPWTPAQGMQAWGSTTFERGN